MLADPRHSLIVLINPARGKGGGLSDEFAARWRESLALLAAAFEIFSVGAHAIGEYDPGAMARDTGPLDCAVGG